MESILLNPYLTNYVDNPKRKENLFISDQYKEQRKYASCQIFNIYNLTRWLHLFKLSSSSEEFWSLSAKQFRERKSWQWMWLYFHGPVKDIFLKRFLFLNSWFKRQCVCLFCPLWLSVSKPLLDSNMFNEIILYLNIYF